MGGRHLRQPAHADAFRTPLIPAAWSAPVVASDGQQLGGVTVRRSIETIAGIVVALTSLLGALPARADTPAAGLTRTARRLELHVAARSPQAAGAGRSVNQRDPGRRRRRCARFRVVLQDRDGASHDIASFTLTYTFLTSAELS